MLHGMSEVQESKAEDDCLAALVGKVVGTWLVFVGQQATRRAEPSAAPRNSTNPKSWAYFPRLPPATEAGSISFPANSFFSGG